MEAIYSGTDQDYSFEDDKTQQVRKARQLTLSLN